MSDATDGTGSVVLYGIEDRPPLGEAIPLGIQHVLAMFLGNVAPPLILAGAVGSVTGDTSFLIQMALIVAGVASRFVVGIGGGVLLLLGFVPKVGAVVSAMPDAVLGGGALILFAMIFSSGARLITQNVTLDHRNSTILALSMALGLGVAFRPEVLQQFPTAVQTLFGSALVTGGLSALALNVVIPGGGVGTGPTEYTDGLDPGATANVGATPEANVAVDDD